MPDPERTKMFAEAGEAADCVRRLLAESEEPLAAIGERLRRHPPRAVLTCARGSSDHAATFAKYLIETRLGVPTASMAPSVASTYGASLHAEEMLCLRRLAIRAQSGSDRHGAGRKARWGNHPRPGQ